MRLFFIILFSGIWSLGFSQDYKFNVLTKYVINQEGKERDRVVYCNSDNPNYFLSLSKTSGDNLAYISDLKNLKVHDLRFIESVIDGQIYFEFKYLETRELKPVDLTADYRFDFETISQDSLYKTVKMIAYKNKKKTRVAGISELKIKKHAKNLFPLYRFSYLHLFEDRTDIDLGENGIVESSKSLGKRKFECQLAFYQDVDLIINIPK